MEFGPTFKPPFDLNGSSSMNGQGKVSTEAVKDSVLSCLAAGPLSPGEVVTCVEREIGASEKLVRDVIWLLIDRGRIDPDEELRLAVRLPRKA
jgi:hypothetical protein